MHGDLFVGRGAELAELAAAFSDTQRGRGRICLCSGEPGIGKTRLAAAVAARARQDGARTLWGSVWDGGGAPAYWPWMQIVRRLAEDAETSPVWRDLGRAAAPLERLAAGSVAAWDPAGPLEDANRFALFDAVATLLRRLATVRPLLIVLDDVHAADVASLLLLEFAGQALADTAVIVVATYRDREAEHDAARAAVLARLVRGGVHLHLGGWREAEVAQYIDTVLGQPSPAELSGTVQRLTGGNPFYVTEIVRDLAARRALSSDLGALVLPASVRELIRERLRPLPDASLAVLRVASLMGGPFGVAVLSEVAALPPAAVLDVLAAGVAGGTLMPAGTPGAWTFAHEIFRAALYEEIPMSLRVQLHHAVGSALARHRDADSTIQLAAIAYHFWHAAPGGDAETAFVYAQRAAAAAAARLAFEEASARYEDALALIGRARSGDPATRAEILLGLGSVRRCLASAAGRPAFQAAADAARAAGDGARLARAALGFADRGLGVPHRAPDLAAVALLEEAHAALPAEAQELQVRVAARLAAELAVSDDRRRGEELSAEAVERARQLADPSALAHALSARHFVLWRWAARADLTGLAAEIVAIAGRLGDPDLEMQGRTWLAFDHMRAGDAVGLDLDIEAIARLTARYPHPRWCWLSVNLRALRALWRGAFADAAHDIGESAALAARVDDESARLAPMIQRFVLLRERGDLAGEEPLARLAAARSVDSPVPRTFLALLLCELGRSEEARPLFDSVAADEFADLEREHRIGVLPYLAEVCAALRDAPRAARLATLLEPLADSAIPYAANLCFGSGAHFLALLAVARGEIETAARYFERALDLHARMQAPPWLARTQLAYADLLRARGAPGDRERAADLVAAGTATAHALGMRSLLEPAARPVLPPIACAAAAPAPPGAARSTTGTFRRQGREWVIEDGNSRVRIKDSKGLRYLAHLLRNPARQLHVIELVDLGGAAAPAAGTAVDAARRRLEALAAGLDEATTFHDLERAARTRAEIDAAAEALARQLGLAGDPAGAARAQRARLNVGRTIADAVRRIAAHNPSLGRYFETTIRTGAFCSFTPDPRLPVDWTVDPQR